MKVKFCGLTSLCEIKDVNKVKPDYVGFVFTESKRRVSIEEAKILKDNLNKKIKVVGVFRNNSIEEILRAYKLLNLDVIQLHGNEKEEFIKEVRRCISNDIEIWKGINVENANILENYKKLDVEAFILDGNLPGSGIKFSWEPLKREGIKAKLFLAGGITEKNIIQGINIIKPDGIDISSGIEEINDRGQRLKSLKKMENIMRKVRMNMKGRFNDFGGQYVPETVMTAVIELEREFEKAIIDEDFIKEYKYYLKDYTGRPTSLYYAENMTEEIGGAKIYLKREDLNHTGAHKINNAIGQVLLAKRMGKKKVIAETGAGQHGVATATVAAKFGMECKIFMGEEDIRRQSLNVKKMELLGAKVIPVISGSGTLKDAVNEAIRYWVENVEDTFYIIGSVVGPHPYPTMVRDFQRIIGDEVKEQIRIKEGRLPDYIIAPIGGGSNAMGIFYPFVEDKNVKLIGVEAAGLGADTDKTAVTIPKKDVGILHGMMTYVLRDEEGEITEAYSISAGLDYPAVGPEHAYLAETERAEYVSITDEEAVDSFMYLTKMEGIIPALESSHAVAYARKLAKKLNKEEIIVVNLSGRGDKDMDQIISYLEGEK